MPYIIMRLIVVLIAFIILLLAVAAWRFSSGPISLSFLESYLETALLNKNSNHEVKFDETALTWGGWNSPLDLQATNVDILDADGKSIAYTPKVSVGIDIEKFFSGNFLPKNIEFINPQLLIETRFDKNLTVNENFFQFLIPNNDSNDILKNIENISLRNGKILFNDIVSGIKWDIPEINFIYSKKTNTKDSLATFTTRNLHGINSDGDKLAEADYLSFVFDGDELSRGRPQLLSVEINNLNILCHQDSNNHFTFGNNTFSFDSGLRDINSDSINIEQIVKGITSTTEIDIFSKINKILINDSKIKVNDTNTKKVFLAKKINLNFTKNQQYGELFSSFELENPSGNSKIFSKIEIEKNNSLILADINFEDLYPSKLLELLEYNNIPIIESPLSGNINLALNKKGIISDDIKFNIIGEAGTIGSSDLIPSEQSFENFRLIGSVNRSLNTIQFNDFYIKTSGPEFGFSGKIIDDSLGYGIIGEAKIINMPFRSLSGFWPKKLLPPSRKWILKNITDGILENFTLQLNLKPGQFPIDIRKELPPDAIKAKFDFKDVTVNYLRPMTPVKGIEGKGHANTKNMFIQMYGGKAGDIYASYGQASFWDLTGANKPYVAITINAKSELKKALELLDQDPLRLTRKFNESINNLDGNINLNFTTKFPMHYGITVNEVEVTAMGQLRNINGKSVPLKDYNLSDGNFEISLNNNQMHVEGIGKLNNSPFEFLWEENFALNKELKTKYEIEATLDKQAQDNLGINLVPFVDGSIKIKVKLTEGKSQQKQASIIVNGDSASLEIPPLKWKKNPGKPATLRMLVQLPEQSEIAEVHSFEIKTDDLFAEGSALINLSETKSAPIESAQISKLLYGDNDFGLSFRSDDDGIFRIAIIAESLDLRPYLDSFLEDSSREFPLFILNIDSNRIITRANQQLTHARANLVSSPKRLERGYMEAKLPTGKQLRIILEPQDDTRRLRLISDDAGSVARAFDIYDNALGGDLFIESTLHDNESPLRISGEIMISNYRVINAPTLAQILNIASLTGILESLEGEGIAFNSLLLPFEKSGPELLIKRAQAKGTSLGIHAEGVIDTESKEVQINGTIAPAYVINSMLSNIPIIGKALAGGEGEGIFAATYSLKGPLDSPTITVNPLAALAPGFLRKVFTIFGDKERIN